MLFKDAVKSLRTELGITQTELSSALHVNLTTISRWELGKTLPNRSIVSVLLKYAKFSDVSDSCYRDLASSVKESQRTKLDFSTDNLYPVEHASLRELIDYADFPIYVCDINTNDLLYINRKCEQMFGAKLSNLKSKKCYYNLMHRNSQCEFCNKEQLNNNTFTSFDTFRPKENTFHRVQGKLIKWNGTPAQVRYIIDVGDSVDVNALSIRDAAYSEQFRIRKEVCSDAVATARFNLSRNTLIELNSKKENIKKAISSKNIDSVLKIISENALASDNSKSAEYIKSRASLIKQYYLGTTHIVTKLFAASLNGYYQGTFDLLQNPNTYDIEAFVCLRDITDNELSGEIISKLFDADYESMAIIDAETGIPRVFSGSHIKVVVQEQNALGDAVAGVESFLRKYCVNENKERVILETSLQYVKKQLLTNEFYRTIYSLNINGNIVHKKAFYSYLDNRKTMIIYATQDISDLYSFEEYKRTQLFDAFSTLQKTSGYITARYDLTTKTFYSDSEMAKDVGCNGSVENVPDEFIKRGLIAKPDEYTKFFDDLRLGKSVTITTPCKVKDGSFHNILINAYILFERDGTPGQALLSFLDTDIQ